MDRIINSISYVEDKVIIVQTRQKLQRMVSRFYKKERKYGIKINAKTKTKVMIIGRAVKNKELRIKINNERIENTCFNINIFKR